MEQGLVAERREMGWIPRLRQEGGAEAGGLRPEAGGMRLEDGGRSPEAGRRPEAPFLRELIFLRSSSVARA